ncbi:uncharacterized protein SOCEGT47_039020 [Sorangium cellulosum]|uniref:Nicotianamine synthase n=1 Tax=Sorangium cellulosum TaxID=56 RepID=A0A4P2Q257_SORCE|nr:nicotianamine synthase family protein [Sorangium cellulosum]AUX23377.1 uncharacterized protein SOCEGT47_039020 [Sorangium cellulosum]
MDPLIASRAGRRSSEDGGYPSFASTSEPGADIYRRFQSLERLLNETRRRLQRFTELDPHVGSIEEMVFSLDDHGLVAEMFLNGLSSHLLTLQHVAYGLWETELERRFIQSLGTAASIDSYRLTPRFRRLIEREVDLLGGAKPARALFIGSGPVPVSAILLHEYLGVPVDCIDIDASAVAQSRTLLERLSLRDRIGVSLTDGAAVDASRHDMVLIALLAKPKAEILAQVSESARPDCRIICRTSLGLRTIVYEPMNPAEDLKHFRVADRRLALHHGDTISSLLLARHEP